MFTDEDFRDIAISQVLSASNSNKRNALFTNEKHLEDVDFIFVDDILGEDIIMPVLEMFDIKDGRLCSVFSSNNLRIINRDALKYGKDLISFNYGVGLDTQIVSYINRYVNGNLDASLLHLIKPLQIKRKIPCEVNVDAYVLENCGLQKEFNSIQKMSIWSVFYFLNLPIMDETSSKIDADLSITKIQRFIEKAKMADRYIDRYYFSYCSLLKIVLLHFDNRSIKDKLLELIRFQNEDICTTDPMFINIALEFWEKGTKISFFSKIQKNQKNILKILKNMSWDLFHWIHTSMNFNRSPYFESNICIPFIYSVDKRFLDITKIVKIDAVAIDHKKETSIPHYSTKSMDEHLSYEEQFELFNAKTLHNRNQNRKKVYLAVVSEELEKQLFSSGIFNNAL